MSTPNEHAALATVLRRARQELFVRDALEFVFGRLISPLLLEGRSVDAGATQPAVPAARKEPIATFNVPWV